MKINKKFFNYSFIIFYLQFVKSIVSEPNNDLMSNKSDSIRFINFSTWVDNFVRVTSLVEKTVTFTCSIELDGIQFLKSDNYKIIWSREVDSGQDYEPLGLDDIRLIPDERLYFERIYVSTQTYDKIKWNLMINYLKLSDSRNYICQLNKKPYDTYWLQKFNLNVNEPAYFMEEVENDQLKLMSNYENSLFLKSVNENQDLRLKCIARGKPLPTITWSVKFFNGTILQLDSNESELVIPNIRKSSRINLVECQAGNGYGAKAIRSFKINLKYAPKILSRPRIYRLSSKMTEFQLNCSVVSNPLPKIYWFFKKLDHNEFKKLNLVINGTNKEWKSLNLLASYSLKHSGSNFERDSLNKYPTPKYHINEKHIKSNFIVSSLLIRSISESDLGVYKCLASNEVANRTVEFTIKSLNYNMMNLDKMRSLSMEKQYTTRKLFWLNFKNFNSKIDEGLDDDQSNKKYNSCSYNKFIYKNTLFFLFIIFLFLNFCIFL